MTNDVQTKDELNFNEIDHQFNLSVQKDNFSYFQNMG